MRLCAPGPNTKGLTGNSVKWPEIGALLCGTKNRGTENQEKNASLEVLTQRARSFQYKKRRSGG